MNPGELDDLQSWLCQEAIRLTRLPGSPDGAAFQAMASEPAFLTHWWSGVFEQSAADSATLDSAARAIAHAKPWPELSLAQRGRLAVRLRLASRILRALGSRHATPPTGWFPARLRKMTKPQLLEWVLVDGWPFWAEVLDESLLWSEDSPAPPPPDAPHQSPPASSSPDAASFAV